MDPPEKGEREPLAHAPPWETDMERLSVRENPEKLSKDNGQQKAPGWWAVGGRYAAENRGAVLPRPSNDARANRLPSGRLRRIIAPARLRRIGLCDVGVSQGDFAWRAPEMVALPRTVRRISDPHLFHSHDQTARRRALRPVRRAEARPGISKKGRIDSRRSSPPYGQATGEGVQVPGTPLKHKDNRKR